jgi:hypothetical protein
MRNARGLASSGIGPGLVALCFHSAVAGRRVRLIRFRGHLPKGGYDVPNGQRDAKPAAAPAV